MIQQTSLQEKLNTFLSGDHQVLLDLNVAKTLPPTIIKLIESEKKHVAERLIEQLVAGLENREISVRQCSGKCLTETAKLLVSKELWQFLDKLLPSLKIIHQGIVGNGLTEKIRASAGKMITAVETHAHGGKPKKSPPRKTGPQKDPLALREEQIFHLVNSDNKDEAKRQLFDLVVSCAKKKDFSNAERLRERIYEIDPMALMEIIHSGEIIEEEKSGSIDKDMLQIWSGLLKVLSSEEFNALYHVMEARNIKPEETLVSQGTKNEELFFINRGCIRVSYFQTGMGGEKELFLKNLASGEIAGENFFNATVWTVSLTALQPSQISILKRNELTRLEEKNPGIESKLRDYYARSIDIAALLNQKGIDRRNHKRFRLERKIHLQIIGNKKKVLSSFNGEMSDISQGGLSFIVRISKKENSRLLLGRNIKANIPLNSGGEKKLFGTIIGVQVYDLIHSDYSVHVKFNSEIERHNLHIIME